ncbi:MAG: hypothetical protein ABR548_00415 [Actinomycetota bacterium]|nr:hypothetical protein [Actinomycetota bacterium]
MRFRVAATALVLATSALACSGSSETTAGKTSSSAVAASEPSAHPPARVVKITTELGANFIAITDDAAWVTQTEAGKVARIDPVSNKIVAQVTVGTSPASIATGFNRLWIANSGETSLSVVDPKSNRVVKTVALKSRPDNVSAGLGFVWVASSTAGAIYQIAPATYALVRTIAVEGTEDVVAGDEGLWAIGPGKNKLTQLDPETGNIMTSIDVKDGAHSIALGSGAVWTGSGPNGNAITRISGAGPNKAIPVEAGAFPDRIAFSPGAVWVGEFRRFAVVKIDPETNAIVDKITVGNGPAVVAVGFRSLWVANYNESTIWRLPL